ncbi:SusC/RagA family TonB-linked outer membrane protein [Flammeovirga yaeyamensis]|uniref:SusC/RagA family TonB-linked outer membrane protein n=2 Tax=Flammeovirga yaeyamensis TaxID=367791 RepID=A0AAX1NC84_9BACT|nr:SusC/RagA family TonB-linked outer membrane protein [Flammeovirga yaeyamensis]MBB3696894.1 TonB-linked SusC/RagA family outer membrane protein [Flammeovirga yaeyamensis]NMF33558.1 SusC/RagA family TonB-linked outer membrane protein [Flammeovirga yaeyamensis]QWG05173.1 SusC/RagA family TonB-linked outer membrane protein [Flammeovirga yaeyamensis]
MKQSNKIYTLLLVITLMFTSTIYAQKTYVEVECIVVDEFDQPINGAILSVQLDEGQEDVFYTNTSGNVTILGNEGDEVIVTAHLKKAQHITLKHSQSTLKIILKDQQDRYEDGYYSGGYKLQERTKSVAFSNVVKQDKLNKGYPLNSATSLMGTDGSVLIEQLTSNPGWDLSNMTLRGLNTSGNNTPAVYIDGFERSIYQINVDEIESVEFLKDISAKILVGPAAINGVLWITTKTGQAVKRKIDVSYEQGIQMPNIKYNYLDSYEYATLYNEARSNDGLSQLYTPFHLEGYRNNTNAFQFPNHEYTDILLKDQTTVRNANVSLTGATAKTKYMVIFGYQQQEGMVSAGPANGLDRLNIRANLSAKMNEFITLKANINARTEYIQSSTLTGRSLFNMLSTHRPNEYTLFVPQNTHYNNSEGFGVSRYTNSNVYAEVNERGFLKEQRIVGQTTVGLDFDLGNVVKGLSADLNAGIDTYNSVTYGQKANYNAFVPIYRADTLLALNQRRQKTELSSQSKESDDVVRDYAAYGRLKYRKSFGEDHQVLAQGMFSYLRQEIKGSNQITDNTTASIFGNYIFKNRYLFEGALANYGSNRFDHQSSQLNYSAGLGWVISNENFLINQPWINYLKLKSSYGLISTDRSIASSQWHQNVWTQSGNVYFGSNNNTAYKGTILSQAGTTGLTWEKQKELNVGIEGRLFHHLGFSLHYFDNHRYDIPEPINNTVINGQEYAQYVNYGEVKNHGVEWQFVYKNNYRLFDYEWGVSGMYSQSKLIDGNVIRYQEDGLNRIGKPINGIYGYQANGLFQSEQEIANSPSQNFGVIRPGDIKFVDQNGDGIINRSDRTLIGDSYPDVILNTHIKLNYKNFEFYTQLSGVFGREILLDNTYFWNYGEGKYSGVVRDRWTESNPNATYPRLTTKEYQNNFQNNSYWIEDGSYVRIDNVQIAYYWPLEKMTKNTFKTMKLYARGHNLFTWSKIKDVDPSNINAGYSNFPLLTTYMLGVQLTI